MKTEVLVTPAEVTTEVTGQVVTVTTVISVVVVPSAMTDEAAAVVPTALETAGEVVVGEVPTAVEASAEEVSATGLAPEAEGEAAVLWTDVSGTEAASVSVTGQIVVETGIVDVTTTVDLAGQFVTSGAQLVIVTSLVAYTVEVVNFWAADVVGAGEEAAGEEAAEVALEVALEASSEEAGVTADEASTDEAEGVALE